MFNGQLRSKICKYAFFAAIITISPVLQAQNGRVALPGTAAYDALPGAVSPAVASGVAANMQFSTIQIPENSSIQDIRERSIESQPSRRNWLILSAVSHSAATFDAYSTRRSIASGNVEADPMMKPFANSPVIYVAIQASPLVMDFAAYELQHSRNRFVRRLWWIPQSTGTAMSVFAGAHNISISNR
jgi:hypothetical protein